MGLTAKDPIRLAELAEDLRDSRGADDALTRAIEVLRDEIQHIHSKWEWGPQGQRAGAGGAYPPTYPARPLIPVYRFDVENQYAVGVDPQYGVHKVVFAGRDRHPPRDFWASVANLQITQALGVVWVEPLGGGVPTPPRYVRLRLTEGPGVAAADHLIGFDYGFERYNANAKKMFVYMSAYPQESTRPDPVELEEQIPVASSKYLSDDNILTETLYQSYMTDGLWIKAKITFFA